MSTLTYPNDVNNNIHIFSQVTAPQVLNENRAIFNGHKLLQRCRSLLFVQLVELF